MRQFWPPVILLLASVVLAVVGVRMTLAGVSHYQTTAFLKAWRLQAIEPDARAWVTARAAATRAVDTYPVDNGQYLDVLGQVYLWKHFQAPLGNQHTSPAFDPDIESSRRQATAALTAAVEARPHMPGAYVRLAHAKLTLLELDPDFRAALATAQRLGPYQSAINAEAAEIGLVAWSSLDRQARERVIKSALLSAQAGSEGRETIVALVRKAGGDELLCSRLSVILRTGETPCL